MRLVTCTRCNGTGKTQEKRASGELAPRRCPACKGEGKRQPPKKNTRSRATSSPWGLVPIANTKKSILNWDWKGAAQQLAKVNATRKSKNLPELTIPVEVTK